MTGTGVMSEGGHECASLVAVAGLAREVEVLRRTAERAAGTAGRLDELAETVARLAEALASQVASAREREPLPSWLDLPRDVGDARVLLADLTEWMATVYLRYADAVAGLPECWLWHPDVVEELLWLRYAWAAAYRNDAPVSVAADWHDRLRPGVVRRIRAIAGTCSLEKHQPRPGQADNGPGGPIVPIAQAADAIAAWWAAARTGAAPAPTDEHLAAASALRTTLRGRP